ncbi:hypothetical protein ABH935_002902 [Catenulispora sp. GAS73]|uniref:hypothetical protein n=1 Tax=Catenulispora sp. GAS73 TaxID=3156269 RepID=UPI0035112F75
MPVFAWPITSAPVSATGMVAAWIGNGVLMPPADRASAIRSSTPRSRKVFSIGSGISGISGVSAVSGVVPAAPVPSSVSFVSSMSFVTALMMYASSVERHCARG